MQSIEPGISAAVNWDVALSLRVVKSIELSTFG